MWYVSISEYYPSSKRKEILTHATTQMNPEDMASEISQSRKDILFIGGTRVVPFIGRESRMVVPQDWGKKRKRNYCLKSLEFRFCKIKRFCGWLWLRSSVNVLSTEL